MNSNLMISVLLSLILIIPTALCLECISCTETIIQGNITPAAKTPCRNRTDGGVSCEGGKVCTTTFRNSTGLLSRGCEEKTICDNVQPGEECWSCTTDLCNPSSGSRISFFSASIVAAFLFLLFGR